MLYGPIIDRFGRKLPLFIGLTIFLIASIACCFVNNIHELIVLRFFQALGACASMVIPRTIVRDVFSPQESARAFSHLILVMGIAPILAPIFGSMLLMHFSWKAIFVFLSIFAVLCLMVSYFLVPETKGPNPADKISHAFKKYYGILHDRNFVICALSGGFAMAGLFAYITGSPFVYLEFFELSAKDYSLVFGANAIGFVLAAQVNAYLLKKFSLGKIVGKILLLTFISATALIFVGIFTPTFWVSTVVFFLFLSCVGAAIPNTTALALSNQSTHAGSASALLGTIQFTLATIASLLISHFNDGSMAPTAMVVGGCGIFALLTYKFFK